MHVIFVALWEYGEEELAGFAGAVEDEYVPDEGAAYVNGFGCSEGYRDAEIYTLFGRMVGATGFSCWVCWDGLVGEGGAGCWGSGEAAWASGSLH